MFDLDTDQTRTFQGRAAADPVKREISGIGVPLEDEVAIYPGFRESFAQDCVFDGIDRAKLKREHRELIGVIIGHEREAGRLTITGRTSDTPAGNESLTLAADGALDSFSIGFRPVEYERTDHDDGTVSIRHTRVLTREFTLTDNPAYLGATVTDVRERQPIPTQGETIMTDTLTRESVDAALDERFTEFTRTLDTRLALLGTGPAAPVSQFRTAGAILKAIADGDDAAISEYNSTLERMFAEAEEREYTGGTTADSKIQNGWVGDLTRIFDASSGVLSAFFSTGALPDTGMNLEYAQLKSNTVKVEEQENEGDDLATGKVVLENKTSPVKTYGGYVELTRQQIQRSTLPILNRSLEALATAAGARKKAVFRAYYQALVAARIALPGDAGVLPIGATLADSVAGDWTDLIVDAAIRFSSLNLSLDGMIASPDVFKRLSRLETNGRRVFNVSGSDQTVGTLDLTALRGDLSSVLVVCDTDRTGVAAEFANARSVRAYDSPLVQLQDENIINLSKQFSAYRFGSVAAEIPAATIPVKFEA